MSLILTAYYCVAFSGTSLSSLFTFDTMFLPTQQLSFTLTSVFNNTRLDWII